MAFQAEIIPFNLRTGTGSQTINHVRYPSMQAVGAILISTDGANTSSEIYSIGLDDGTTHMGMGVGFWEAFGVCLTARGYSTVYSMAVEQAQVAFGGASRRTNGYVSSFNVGSITIQVDLNNTPGNQWYVIVIGGTDVQCKVGLRDSSSGNGDVNVGFDPVALIHLGVPDASFDGEVAGAYLEQGFATLCDANQVGWGAAAGSITSDAKNYQIADIIGADIAYNTAVGGSVTDTKSISAWITNGFTVQTPTTADWNVGFMALGGDAVSANLVPIIQPTSTGVQDTTIDASEPELVLFGSTNQPTSLVVNADFKLSFGAYDGVSQLAHWCGLTNGSSSAYPRDARSSTTKSIVMATATGAAASTVNAEASASYDVHKVSLNWTTVDATARELWALVLANNPFPSSPNPCGLGTGDDELTCSITIVAPAPIPSAGIQQWQLHRFDAKFRGEQTS